jgi:SAM-dependent methyltransferase
MARLVSRGMVVASQVINEPEASMIIDYVKRNDLFKGDIGLVVEHDKLPFVSYPYEWPAERLFSAGKLTLDIAADALKFNLNLKDATPYNVLFKGSKPIFVDVPSLEKSEPCNQVWHPYSQFERTFILPLMANKHFGISINQSLLARRDGLEPEDLYKMCSVFKKVSLPFLTTVTISTLLSSFQNKKNDLSIYETKKANNAEKAHFILNATLAGLRRKLQRSKPALKTDSTWSDYMLSGNNYSNNELSAKADVVKQILEEAKAKNVLDVGCNNGFFSFMAAKAGASVVALDYDPVVVGMAWKDADEHDLDVLPLVVDLSRPSPSLGWDNSENKSFLERARGKFDMVMMLAVIHHMHVGEMVPIERIVKLVSEITTKHWLVEYVSKDDPMFRKIARGRDYLFTDYTREYFETICAKHFNLVSKKQITSSGRWIYLFKKNA